jgi:hypothetical protein
MQGDDLETKVKAYLEAYDERDLDGCLDFFAEDAIINFAMGVFRGRPAIEEWHQDRFKADLRITRIDKIKVKGEKVTVDGVITSKTAKAWGFDSVAGRATLQFQNGKIRQVKFGLRMSLPLEGW